MLTKLMLENFKCFEKAEVSFEPLTVLVGPNNSGKSSILQALQAFASDRRRPIQDVFGPLWDAAQWNRGDNGQTFRLTISLAAPNGENYDPVVWEYRANHPRPPDLSGRLGASLDKAAYCALDPTILRSGTHVLTVCQMLGSRGEGLAGVLDFYKREHSQSFEALRKDLGRTLPGITDIPIPRIGESLYVAFSEVGTNKPIPAIQASDGLLLLLAFLVMAHHPEPPGLLLIEEPENGIHPRALRSVMDILRGLTEGHYGTGPIQVILTTHSPYLLDFVRPEDVRVFLRDPKSGAATCKPLTETPHLDDRLKDFTVGELWYNVDEDGIAGQQA